jgi:hypothetical protein
MGNDPTASSSGEQLAAIRSFDAALDQAALDYWLFGGWAVDFWVGSITRPHDDIDVAAWRKDYDAIRAALIGAGWEHTPTENDVVGTRYTLRNTQVEITFVEQGGQGEIVIPIPETPIVWTTEPFGELRRALEGVEGRVISLALLRGGKARPREEAKDAAKDRADYEALAQVIA